MTTLTSFFKDTDSSLGVFYPKDYIIATFPSFEKTKQAAQALRGAGYSENEVLAIPGEEILQFFEDFRAHSGLWSSTMTVISRAFGTEQVFADSDVESARAGAGFLAVHSPEEPATERVHALVQPFGPRAMHWYTSGGVQCLI